MKLGLKLLAIPLLLACSACGNVPVEKPSAEEPAKPQRIFITAQARVDSWNQIYILKIDGVEYILADGKEAVCIIKK